MSRSYANSTCGKTPVVVLSSESSCSDDETPSNNKTSIKCVKTAPVFLRAAQHRKVALDCTCGPVSFSRRSSKEKADVAQDTERNARGQVRGMRELSGSVLQSSLEEIQTSNPSFAVQAVLSSLRKKAGAGCSSQSYFSQDSRDQVSKSLPKCHSSNNTKVPTGQDVFLEDSLWTDKYSPQNSNEVIGNAASVTKLHAWLRKWKLRVDRDERREAEKRKQEENDLWDSGDFQGEAVCDSGVLEHLNNTVLITGPSGVGKTASVYACAQELGFKVFEVNCSSQRSGRHVLSQLKEATQSHLVKAGGKDALKPSYFSCSNVSGSNPKLEHGKIRLPKNGHLPSKKTLTKKSSVSFHKGRNKADTITLAHFFKMKSKADSFRVRGPSPADKSRCPSAVACEQPRSPRRKTATSLILFEEVDVIFADDVGFLSAIKAFMQTTKRPVILTTTDPLFKDRFDSRLQEIILRAPAEADVCSYLQLLGLCENVRLDSDDVRTLYRLTGGDVRRCLLQLQLWVHSGGGAASPSRQVIHPTQACLEPCLFQTSCSSFMLGLTSASPTRILNFLEVWSETDVSLLLKFLTESWKQNLPLLYNNLELLLSLQAEKTKDQRRDSCLQRELLNSHLQQQHTIPAASPSSRTSGRRISRLSRKNRKARSVTNKPQETSSPLTWTPTSDPLLFQKLKRDTAKIETKCLSALADFFDLMSYSDATFPPALDSCTRRTFMWTGVAVVEGQLDEMRDEDDRNESLEGFLDMRAAIEGFGYYSCWTTTSKWWAEDNMHIDLQKPPDKEQVLNFLFEPLCSSSVSQRRWELSQAILSSRLFSLQGNKQSVFIDYMPAIRFIHHEQKRTEARGRSLSYWSRSSPGISTATMQRIDEDFSWRRVWKEPQS